MTPFEVTSPHNNTVYYLHSSCITLRNHAEQRIYYFCKDIRDNAVAEVPEGYVIIFSERTGMPVLMKIRNATGA